MGLAYDVLPFSESVISDISSNASAGSVAFVFANIEHLMDGARYSASGECNGVSNGLSPELPQAAHRAANDLSDGNAPKCGRSVPRHGAPNAAMALH
jgi:hypothetical protein